MWWNNILNPFIVSVSETEKRRLQDAFRRSSAANSNISKQVFIQDVLGECVPSSLADQIFSQVGGGRGVTFRELLTLLVLVTRGTREEKFKCRHQTTVGWWPHASLLHSPRCSYLWHFIRGVRGPHRAGGPGAVPPGHGRGRGAQLYSQPLLWRWGGGGAPAHSFIPTHSTRCSLVWKESE